MFKVGSSLPGTLQAGESLTVGERRPKEFPDSGMCGPLQGQGLHGRIIAHYLSGSKKGLKAQET